MSKKEKETVKVNTAKADNFKKPNVKDFKVIISPIITEKSMANIQNLNQVTLKVCPCANKSEIKHAFERLYQVKATHVNIVNVRPTSTTRGGRYQGTIKGYKKAVVTIKQGQAIDLFKE